MSPDGHECGKIMDHTRLLFLSFGQREFYIDSRSPDPNFWISKKNENQNAKNPIIKPKY